MGSKLKFLADVSIRKNRTNHGARIPRSFFHDFDLIAPEHGEIFMETERDTPKWNFKNSVIPRSTRSRISIAKRFLRRDFCFVWERATKRGLSLNI